MASFLEKHHIYISTMPPRNEKEYLRLGLHYRTKQEKWISTYFLYKAWICTSVIPEGTELNYEKALLGVLAREEIDWNRRNVLVAHQFFTTNGQQPQMCDSRDNWCRSWWTGCN